ncbi:MAG: S8 family serine peptidase [Longimicrobiales bacterium]|nr:S8 family serine peptidase [Longimicrobiales bacterium]
MRTFLRIIVFAPILSLPILFSSCGDGGGGAGPDPVPAESLASFMLTVPDSIAEGEAFALTVAAVGNRGSNPLTSYSGSVGLSTTLGTVSPSSVAVSGGAGSAQVTLSNPGQQTLSVAGGGKSGSAAVDVTDLPDPTIPGDLAATLEQAVQDSVFLPNGDDYSTDHPNFPGVYVSHNTIMMTFAVGTTVDQANELLSPLGAQLAGAIGGVPGTVSPILILKIPHTTHLALDGIVEDLRASALITSLARDALLESKSITRDNGGNPADWTWDHLPFGGNWALELLRVPQMWNLNRALEKAQAVVWTGIRDVGFFDGHEDLGHRFPVVNLSPGVGSAHGTGVAGIIGADFNNGKGIDGVNPFSGMIVAAQSWNAVTGPLATGSFAQATTNIASMLYQYPEIRVLNISLGFTAPGDANTDLPWQQHINSCGLIFATMLQTVGTTQRLPVISASAGNESNSGFGLQPARYQSPFCNASIEHGIGPVLCVEALSYHSSSPGDAIRSVESNVGGHLSAPGTAIRSTSGPPYEYGLFPWGTSYAAPHVAGLVGYMLAVDPTLTNAQVWTALFNTSIPVGGFASNRIDAWAAVMEIDRVQGDHRVLRMMLDIDDGTSDGGQFFNFEQDPGTPEFTNDSLDADGDGGIGDGSIDMSDFRRWRDWYHHIWKYGSHQLEGTEDHLKMDVNENGVTEDDVGESLYPRGDFNGDGILTLEDSAWVPGAVQESLTDLDVLKVLFDDPNYDASDLDTLVYSMDLHINPRSIWENTSAFSVKIEVRDADSERLVQSRIILRSDDEDPVLTLPSVEDGARKYRIEVSTPNIDFTFGDHIFYFESGGWDHYLRPVDFKKVPVRGAFLRVCEEDTATSPEVLDLAAMGLSAGDRILGYAVGDAALAGPGPEGDASVYAVFSGSARLLGDDKLNRVPDAIATPLSTYRGPVQCNDTTTIQMDIPEDFRIPNEGAVFDVPVGATHLFLARMSSWYKDNFDVDDDYGLHLVVLRKDFPIDNWGLGQVAYPEHSGEQEVWPPRPIRFEQWVRSR